MVKRAFAAPAAYEIEVRGGLDRRWSGQLAGMEVILQPNGDTRLAGLVADQAALYGLLSRLRDLGLVLVSVRRVTEH